MPDLWAERKVGETRICYYLEHNGVYYSMRVSAAPAKVESVYVTDVARDEGTAKRILALFADNLVFPISVYEIFDDLYASDFSDNIRRKHSFFFLRQKNRTDFPFCFLFLVIIIQKE